MNPFRASSDEVFRMASECIKLRSEMENRTRITVVTCDDSYFEGLYVNGTLEHQSDTIYAESIAENAKNKLVEISHFMVQMPKGLQQFPTNLEDCMKWPDSYENNQ